MRVYLDTGVFIDYLINRSHAGHYLRKGARRGRTPGQLNKDVVSCLSKIGRKHEGFTSCLALYELEDALFTELKNAYKRLVAFEYDHYSICKGRSGSRDEGGPNIQYQIP